MFDFLKEEVSNEVREVKVSELMEFREKIFSPYEGERLDEMVASVKSYGIITPIIVRRVLGDYEILSGQNRVNAARIVGLQKVPVIIKEDLSNDEARFIVTESNVVQRGFMEMKISERARCITVRHESMKSQGIRNDLLREFDELIDDEFNGEVEDVYTRLFDAFDLSSTNVKRYVRIDKLIDEIKGLVDDGSICFTAGVDISYMDCEYQEDIAEIVVLNGIKVSVKQGEQLRGLARKEMFTKDRAISILVEEPAKKQTTVRLTNQIMDKYFEGYDRQDIYVVLEKALEMWFEHKK